MMNSDVGAQARGSSLRFAEDVFDSRLKEPRDPKCEGKRWVVLASFYGVHRLARHAQPVAKVCLAPVSFRAEQAKVVFHSALVLQGAVLSVDKVDWLVRSMKMDTGSPGLFCQLDLTKCPV
jgi:hypothetical protein